MDTHACTHKCTNARRRDAHKMPNAHSAKSARSAHKACDVRYPGSLEHRSESRAADRGPGRRPSAADAPRSGRPWASSRRAGCSPLASRPEDRPTPRRATPAREAMGGGRPASARRPSLGDFRMPRPPLLVPSTLPGTPGSRPMPQVTTPSPRASLCRSRPGGRTPRRTGIYIYIYA